MTRRMTRRLLAPLLAMLIAACTATPHHSVSPTRAPLLAGPELRFVDHRYLNRYMCADGHPLMCTCGSRLARECLCQCQGFGPGVAK